MKPKTAKRRHLEVTKPEETNTTTRKTKASPALDSPCSPLDVSGERQGTRKNKPTNGSNKTTSTRIRKKRPTESVNSRGESPPKMFQCVGCDKQFRKRHVLDAHELTHTGERPHTCPTCGQGFGQSSTLAQHRRRHSGARPYRCDRCGATYRQQNGLTRHMLRHRIDGSEGGGYVCDDCGARFTRRDTLVLHLRTHSGIKPFKCPYCELRVANRRSIPRHIQRKHKDKIGLQG